MPDNSSSGSPAICQDADYTEVKDYCKEVANNIKDGKDFLAPGRMISSNAKTNRKYLKQMGVISAYRDVCQAEYRMLTNFLNLIDETPPDKQKQRLNELCNILVGIDTLAQRAKTDLTDYIDVPEKKRPELRRFVRGLFRSHWSLVDAVERSSMQVKTELEKSIKQIYDALKRQSYFLDIFVCYASKDDKNNKNKTPLVTECLDALEMPLTEKHIGFWWDRKKLIIGDQWNDEIRRELSQVDVGLLFISENLFESDYITNNELPSLLERRESQGIKICPVFLMPPDWDNWKKNYKWLHQTQGLPTDKGLRDMSPGERNKLYKDVMAPQLVQVMDDITKFKITL